MICLVDARCAVFFSLFLSSSSFKRCASICIAAYCFLLQFSRIFSRVNIFIESASLAQIRGHAKKKFVFHYRSFFISIFLLFFCLSLLFVFIVAILYYFKTFSLKLYSILGADAATTFAAYHIFMRFS